MRARYKYSETRAVYNLGIANGGVPGTGFQIVECAAFSSLGICYCKGIPTQNRHFACYCNVGFEDKSVI